MPRYSMVKPTKLDNKAANAPIAQKVASAPIIPRALDEKLDKAAAKNGSAKKEASVINISVSDDVPINTKRKQSKVRLDSDEDESDDEPMVRHADFLDSYKANDRSKRCGQMTRKYLQQFSNLRLSSNYRSTPPQRTLHQMVRTQLRPKRRDRDAAVHPPLITRRRARRQTLRLLIQMRLLRTLRVMPKLQKRQRARMMSRL